jgi:capsular polysaccharide biosynthesis protein
VAGFARDIESPAIAKEVIRRLGLRMTPDELLENLTVEPEPESAFGIRLAYRDPTGETPRRARKIVLTVAEVAGERVHKETPYAYTWGVGVLG